MNTSRRGFAAVFAITLIILVGAALVALGRYFADDAKRTRAQAIDAQLRQLLTAGAVLAINEARAGNPPATQRSVSLPRELRDGGARLSIGFWQADNDHLDVSIRAQLALHTTAQILRLERRDGRWQPVAATLDSTQVSASQPAQVR